MDRIKFGTDGWRGIIASDFTVANVNRLSDAAASWLRSSTGEPSVVIGYDTRFGSRMFAETAARVFAARNIKVYLSAGFVTTPMVSYSIVKLGANLGMMITASHNPGEYSGIKLKGYYGGSLFDEVLKNIEDLVPEDKVLELELVKWEDSLARGLIEIIDMEGIYSGWIKANFDLEGLKRSGIRPAFDLMFGSSQSLIKKLFPGYKKLNAKTDPWFGGMSPEPMPANLAKLSELVGQNRDLSLGFAFDGDGDRCTLINEKGEHVEPHRVLGLLIRYLAETRGGKGRVLAGFSSSSTIDALCKKLGLQLERTRNGFRHITRRMVDEKILVAGEQSGGYAFSDHIPERDGIWTALVIWQILDHQDACLSDLIAELEEITGTTCYRQDSLTIGRDRMANITGRLTGNRYERFGRFEVRRLEEMDGYKYYISNKDWVLVRLSGTEPLLRICAETGSGEKTAELLEAVRRTLTET
jgi:phosphomannomutase